MKDFRNLPPEVLERLACVVADDEPGRGARHGLDRTSRDGIVNSRIFAPTEIRTLEDGGVECSGYATVYSFPYDVAGGAPYGWAETIAPGACAKSLAENDRVVFLSNHDADSALGLPIATTYGDGGLTLASDGIGLRVDLVLHPTNVVAQMLIDGITSKRVDSMSFAFQTLRQEWNTDYTERTITELKLFDVSAVTYPANPAAIIAARTAQAPQELWTPARLDLRRRELDLITLRHTQR